MAGTLDGVVAVFAALTFAWILSQTLGGNDNDERRMTQPEPRGPSSPLDDNTAMSEPYADVGGWESVSGYLDSFTVREGSPIQTEVHKSGGGSIL